MLRVAVLAALERAQARLQMQHPGWTIRLFDAYRPIAVQAFMVQREYDTQLRAAGLDPSHLSPTERMHFEQKVFRVWGVPSNDPATPPLHSTGGSVDCTLADHDGCVIDMGSPIDESSDRSNPNYFATAKDSYSMCVHSSRILLYQLMHNEGFHRVTTEWWHFSRGDQYWAWAERATGRDPNAIARYGRGDLL
jgi:zinc D-Ala-D-Ala dipeptidase